MAKILHSESLLESASRVLGIEAEAINELIPHLDAAFVRACELILDCHGRVVVTGMGKSGHVGRKIAATLASTGTPAFFVHPAEASHGDLGMITRDDVVVALSNSGRTEEVLRIVPSIKREGARLIALTGDAGSTLAGLADVHLFAGARREACPLNLAPTASTTAALALGDALAVALLEARGFAAEDFARSHPGGALGRRLLTRVSDVMRTGDQIPTIEPVGSFSGALIEMSRKRMGMVAIVDPAGGLLGIFTDGDLRRLFSRPDGIHDIVNLKIRDVMTASPSAIRADQLAAEAVRIMEERKIGQLLVIDDERRLVGAVNFHDLLEARVT